MSQPVKLPYGLSKWDIFFPIGYGLLIYLNIRLVNDVISDTRIWNRPWQTNASDLIVGGLCSYVFYALVKHFLARNEKLPLTGFQSRAFFREVGRLVLYLLLTVICTLFPLAALTDDGLQWHDVIILSLIPVLYWLVYYLVSLGSVLMKKNYQQQLQLEKVKTDQLETELAFLKAQFHPHFLFNALNTVYFQIDENNANARYSLEKLSDLLRYQLYDQEQTVPLQREFEFLQTYIDLQKQRVSDRLHLRVSFPDPQPGQKIYPLLLLPLVENAFKYVGGEYQLEINCSIERNQLNFEVLNSIPAIAKHTEKGGIGLENLRRRLNLLYPGQQQLSFEKSASCFTARLALEL